MFVIVAVTAATFTNIKDTYRCEPRLMNFLEVSPGELG